MLSLLGKKKSTQKLLPYGRVTVSIDRIFSPGVFDSSTGIYVSSFNRYKLRGYQILPFRPPYKNRNHYDERNGNKVVYLIMHYTVANFPRTVDIFTSNTDSNRTSAHYVISQREKVLSLLALFKGKLIHHLLYLLRGKRFAHIRGGRVLQVVPEGMNAWHAGVSFWGTDRVEGLNKLSIGIEHVNKGFTPDIAPIPSRRFYAFDETQISASGKLSSGIIAHYGILPQHVLGHEDIAPGRKSDPGPLFPWNKLYQVYGVGAWLDEDEQSAEAIVAKYGAEIQKQGYTLPPCPSVSSNILVNHNVLIELLSSYGYYIPTPAEENKGLVDKIVANTRKSRIEHPTSSEGLVKQQGTVQAYRNALAAHQSNVIKAFKAHFSFNGRVNAYKKYINEVTKEDLFWAWALNVKYIWRNNPEKIKALASMG